MVGNRAPAPLVSSAGSRSWRRAAQGPIAAVTTEPIAPESGDKAGAPAVSRIPQSCHVPPAASWVSVIEGAHALVSVGMIAVLRPDAQRPVWLDNPNEKLESGRAVCGRRSTILSPKSRPSMAKSGGLVSGRLPILGEGGRQRTGARRERLVALGPTLPEICLSSSPAGPRRWPN